MADTPDQAEKPEHSTIRIEHVTEAAPRHVVSLRCHSCRQRGTFEPLGTNDVLPTNGVLLGQRRCPNPACHAHVFFVHRAGQPLLAYPHERLDFDSSDVPPKIVAALEQAITCHANQCYEAAGMMVARRWSCSVGTGGPDGSNQGSAQQGDSASDAARRRGSPPTARQRGGPCGCARLRGSRKATGRGRQRVREGGSQGGVSAQGTPWAARSSTSLPVSSPSRNT